MARERTNNQLFVILIIVLAIAFWYGGVFVGTQKSSCSGSEVWVWTPPPHWRCANPYGQ